MRMFGDGGELTRDGFTNAKQNRGEGGGKRFV